MKIRVLLISGTLLVAVVLASGVQFSARADTITVVNTNDSGAGSLRQAVADASPGDTIVFDLAYPATISLGGTIDITKTLTISGPGSTQLTIFASNFIGALNVSSGVSASVSGLTITNRHSWGYGIASSGTLTVTHSMFSGNGEAGIDSSGTLVVTDSIFSGNGSDGIDSSGTLTVTNSTVSGNGYRGIHNSDGWLMVTNSTVSGNGGTGIDNYGGWLTVTNSTVSDNSSSGIDNSSYGSLTVLNSNISGNTGSGIYNGGALTVINSTFYSNTHWSYGGAIYDSGVLGVMTIINGTFSGNGATLGGGAIYVGDMGKATLKNTIIADSAAGGNCDGVFQSASTNNLATDGTCSPGFTQVTPARLALGPLTGSPAYFPLNPGSAAIDTGTDNGCPATDQRRLPRFGQCDIGAYEMQPIGFSGKAVNQLAASPGDAVTYTITLTNGGGLQLIDVWVTDTLPTAVVYVDNSLTATAGSPGYDKGVITWTGPVNANGTATIAFKATVSQTTPSATITNSAVISGGGELITRTATTNVKGGFVYLPVLLK